MNKDLAKKLIPILNHLDAVQDYANSRIDYHKDQLSTATSFDDVLKHQGAIRELSQLVNIRQTINDVLKRDF